MPKTKILAFAATATLISLGLSGLAAAASIPTAVTVEQAAPVLTQSTEYGPAASGWNSSTTTAPTTGSETSLTFPTATLPSGSGVSVLSSDWVGVKVSVANATSSTDWEVYGSSTKLTNSTNSADTIAASAIKIPNGAYGSVGALTVGGGGSWSSSSPGLPGGTVNAGDFSSTSTALWASMSAESTSLLAFQPELAVPANTPPGTYSGTITLSAQIQ